MIQIIPVEGIGEITAESDFPGEILAAGAGPFLQSGDILVVSSKVVSKWEGNVRKEAEIQVTPEALHLSELIGKPAAYCQVVLEETAETVRLAKGVMVSRTHHGFVLANAGVDASNTGEAGDIIPMPKAPEESAQQIREEIRRRSGAEVAVVISDTFGRPFRKGQIDLAIGVAGMEPMLDYAGSADRRGKVLKTTCMAIADELCSAANLAAEKTAGVPAVIIRGYDYPKGEGSIQDILMERERDLFA